MVNASDVIDGEVSMRNSRPATPTQGNALDTIDHTAVNFQQQGERQDPAAPLLPSQPPVAPTQGSDAATRSSDAATRSMFGCLLQAGSAPFRLMWSYPRTTVAFLATAVNALGQSCMYGTPGFEGAPQQYCNDAAKAMMDNKMIVTGMAGTLFAMGAHMATDAVSRFRTNRAEAEVDATVRAAM